jgi:hypothetical protein
VLKVALNFSAEIKILVALPKLKPNFSQKLRQRLEPLALLAWYGLWHV